jgi:hypothetical protein
MNKMGLRVLAAIPAVLLLAGCSDGPFDQGQAQSLLEGQKFQLDKEQVTITAAQVNCGERDDLWVVLKVMEGRFIARLNDKSRALGFSDDIQIGDPDFKTPYGQVSGKFQLEAPVVKLTDLDPQTKIAEAKVKVKIDHSCFAGKPAVLMGVRKGRFNETFNSTFRFRLAAENWQVDQLLH